MRRLKKIEFFLLKFVLLMVGVAFCMPSAFAENRNQVLTKNSIATVYVNADHLYELLYTQLDELNKQENKEQLEAINNRIQTIFQSNFYYGKLLKEVEKFISDNIFVPNGSLWFSIDNHLKPALVVSAKIDPDKLFSYMKNRFAFFESLAVKKNNGTFEAVFTIGKLRFSLLVNKDYLSLSSESLIRSSDVNRWVYLTDIANKKNTLIAAQIDMDRIKALLVNKDQKVMQTGSLKCMVGFELLNTAIQMYDTASSATKITYLEEKANGENNFRVLSQQTLKKAGFLDKIIECPEKGVYGVDDSKQLVCSAHGNLLQPTWIKQISSSYVNSSFSSISWFNIKLSEKEADLSVVFNNSDALKLWHDILKQQLLTLRYIAENQDSQISKTQRVVGLKILDAILVSYDGLRLSLKTDELNEKIIASFLVSIAGTIGGMLEPSSNQLISLNKQKKMISLIPAAIPSEPKNFVEGECKKARNIIYDAVKSYMIGENNMSDILTIEQLKAKGYLKHMPRCSSNGKYSLGNDNGVYSVDCSEHR